LLNPAPTSHFFSVTLLLQDIKMRRLDEDQISQRLARLNGGWARKGDCIEKTFTFDRFSEAIDFVNRVARLAEAADHHPDFDIRYTTVTLALSTHSAGGLTSSDFDLAAEIG
jgi:4a-hydroxytetrahydrobiopterin dehydratase